MKTSFLKTGHTRIVQVIDKETAEILSEEVLTSTYIANSKEQFFLGYFDLLSVIQNISGPSIKMYFYLLITYKAGVLIGINKVVKKQIQSYLRSKSLGSVNNCLTELCQCGLLIKMPDELAGYYVNPRFAYIGNSKARLKSLQSLISTVNVAA